MTLEGGYRRETGTVNRIGSSVARRRTCVADRLCQGKPHASGPVRRNAPAEPRRPRLANSYAKRWTIFARVSMVRVLPSKPSRSDFLRPEDRASISRHLKRERHQLGRGVPPSGHRPRVAVGESDQPPAPGHVRHVRLCSARAGEQRQKRNCRNRHAVPRVNARPHREVRRHVAAPEPGARVPDGVGRPHD
jgi:hypothetical protein